MWRKSTRSGATGACVEVQAVDGAVLVRDSKDPDGPRLAFSIRQWRTFVTAVAAGEFDRVQHHH
jgi:hypothetical protein